MKTRLYTPQDYAEISQWWPAHKWFAVPEVILPKCGIVVLDDAETLRAAAWLYMDNSTGVGMMEWTVTNPANTPKKSLVAIKVLLGAIKALALEFDYGVVLTSVKNPALQRRYESGGFSVTDKEVTLMAMLTKQ